MFMEVPHKGGYGIVNYNPRRTYCPLVPKRDTFYVTNGSPQSPVRIGSGHRSNTEVIMSHFEFLMPIDSMSGSTT